jgi:glycine amidinotransferase
MDMVMRADALDAARRAEFLRWTHTTSGNPLEEVIVGRLEGAVIPSDHPVVTCNIPDMAARAQSLFAGFHYPKIMIEPAQRELDGFAALLQSLGIVVRQPEAVDNRKRFRTPQWFGRR